MKRKLFLLSILISFSVSSQEIKYDKDYNLPDFLVVEVKGGKKDLYNKSLSWINQFYKNPKEVITVNETDNLIKFNGSCVDCLVMSLLGKKDYNTLNYIITLKFKENRYKFEINSVTFENADDLKNAKSTLTKKNGKLKKILKRYPKIIESELSHIFKSLKSYIKKKQRDDW